jgi:predicted enzyme related to lactoylglutathione lyase
MEQDFQSILWHDITVDNADKLSEFYSKVVGWTIEPLSMGDYNDYVMKNSITGAGTAGVCHARGVNQGLPPQWLAYVKVQDMEASLENCTRLGGKIIGERRNMGDQGEFCLIQDPAGAHMMLFASPTTDVS